MEMVTKRFFAIAAFALALIAFPVESMAQSRPYDIAQLDAPTRSAVEQARAASIRGTAAAGRALGGGGGTITFDGEQNTRYMGEGYGTGADVQRNGFGLLTWPDGEYYAGENRAGRNAGLKDGSGIYSFVDGRLYEGQWQNDLRHGYGVQWNASGQIDYAGLWNNGNPAQ